ncbi:MAG: hypothetical protein ABIJ00_05435 [Candidatus Eisenbacteria bacterium]
MVEASRGRKRCRLGSGQCESGFFDNTHREKIDELGEASEEAWGDMKAGVEEATKDLRTALNAAATKFE